MPDRSRRSALHAVATTGLFLVAGCSDTTTSSRADPPEARRRVTDFEAIMERDPDGEPLIIAADPSDSDGPQPGADSRSDVSLMEHWTDTDDLADYTFPDTDRAQALADFVRDTPLASQSLYVLQRPIGECYVPRLVDVYRDDDGVDAEFCRQLRPADAACAAETDDVFAVVIRLPFSGDGFNSVGSGWGSDCDHRPSSPLTARGDGA